MLTLLFSKLILTRYIWANFVILTRFQEYVHKMYCWFWGIKTSKGEGDIHRNAQRVHMMSFILRLNWSHYGKTNVITAEKICVLTRSFGVLFQLRGGRDVRNSFWWQKTYTIDYVCTSGFWASYNETDCIISTTWGEVVSGYFWYILLQPSAGKKFEKN